MKRIIILILISIAYFSIASAQEDTITNSKETETVVVTEWEDVQEGTHQNSDNHKKINSILGWDFSNPMESGMAIAVLSVILIFGLPFFVIFISFYFKYKNRKAKYKLIEQALASGQPLPENFLKEVGNSATRNKGITNIFTGLGLFIFLWAITGNFGVGSIGLLIMFIGFGQAAIHYSQDTHRNNKKDNSSEY